MNKPKVFISYSWCPEYNKIKVKELAEKLRKDGVDVIIDIWDLKAGQDKNTFMEQMLLNEVKKVLLICNKEYAEKANERRGGVGIESIIISEEIYQQADQTKFIPVVFELSEDEKPYLPSFVKSRVFIDLSKGRFEKGYDQLIRDIYDKPLYERPSIGRMPRYLEKSNSPLLLTLSSQRNLCSPKRILLIEDNGEVSYDIKKKLKDSDYDIKHADSYLSAVGMWRRYEGQFKCIILDLNINPEGLSPEESSSFFPVIGLSFLNEIGRNEELAKEVKIVIYSAYITEFKIFCTQKRIPFSNIIIIEKSQAGFDKLINYIKLYV